MTHTWTLDASDWPLIINDGDRVVCTIPQPESALANNTDTASLRSLADANLIIQAINAYDPKPAFVTLKTLPICDTHSRAKRTTPARCCHVCQRMVVEQEIAAMTVDALLAAGYLLNVRNGGDTPELSAPTTDRQAVLDIMFATDDEFLVTFKPGRDLTIDDRPDGWVRFVYGNDGYDLISDYTTNLEAVLAPVNAFTHTLD